MTLIEVLRRATGYLEQHGSGSPRLDAEVLLAHSLGLRRLDLYLQFERLLSDAELAPYRELITRRGQGGPVAYLVGRKEFMGLDFEVTPDVLVPNPDTELLVQLAVQFGRARGGQLRFADVGTGSGCIAVALAHFLPEAEVFASDISAAALAVATRNVARHSVAGRVHLAEADLLERAPAELDAVCANLPYLDEEATLPPEVLAQPRQALFGGDRLLKRLLEQAPAKLRSGGVVLAELDPSVAAAVVAHAKQLFGKVQLHRDLGGHERVVEAWKS